MSDSQVPAGDEAIVEQAKAAYAAFISDFEAKFGYTINAEAVMKLIKLIQPSVAEEDTVETPANTTQNVDNTPEETSGGNSSEREEG